MKKIIILLFLMSCLIHAAFADTTKTLRFATEATYPPFEYIDEKGDIQGFDIDIAKAICTEINVKCEFSNQSFNSLIPSLALSKFDAVIAALGVTPERQKEVDFTESYYEPSAAFVTEKDKAITLANLTGKTIGVQQGSTFEKYLHDHYGDTIHIKSYASIQDTFLDLISERLDAVLTDTPIASAWLKASDNQQYYHVIGKPIIDHQYFGTGYAIAINKNNSDLLVKLNQGLAKIKANGTYEAIFKKYFPHDNSERPKT